MSRNPYEQIRFGTQVLYRDAWNLRVAYVETEDKGNLNIIFSGAVTAVRVRRDSCIILPDIGRPITAGEAFEWWKYGKEIRR